MTREILALCGFALCLSRHIVAQVDNEKRLEPSWYRPPRGQFNKPSNHHGGFQSHNHKYEELRRPSTHNTPEYLRPSGDFGINVNNVTAAVNFPPNPPEASNPSPKSQKLMNPCEKDCHKIPDDYPVCGTDKVTYKNITHLKCAQTCGKRIKTAYQGKCKNAPTPTGSFISPGRSSSRDE